MVEEDFLVSFVEGARKEMESISLDDDSWFQEGMLTYMTRKPC